MSNLKKKNKKEEGEIYFGTPSMAMFPARNYYYKIIIPEHKISIPRTGEYNEIAPSVFSKEDGVFCILDEKSHVLFTPAITKVLFAVSKYPDLKTNQLYIPIALTFKNDVVDIIGQVVEVLPPPYRDTT